MATELTWHDVLAEEKQQPYFINTLHTVAGERQSGITVYPPQKDVFNAFRFTELGDVKVVILGQDPYHGPGQAHDARREAEEPQGNACQADRLHGPFQGSHRGGARSCRGQIGRAHV